MKNSMVRLIAFILLLSQCYGVDLREEYQYMDHLAVQAGADKGSFYHDYTRVYSRYFFPLKNKPIKFLEIGLFEGGSARLWENYFPKAELHFIDITLSRAKYFSKRCFYHLADQSNPKQLVALIDEIGGNFDIILDDGGHTMRQQITSFKVLFPYVKSGGMYIIEDLHTSYWPDWPNDSPSMNTITFLKGLIDDINFVGAKTARASHVNLAPEIIQSMNFYQAHIESIHFYDSIAIVIRR